MAKTKKSNIPVDKKKKKKGKDEAPKSSNKVRIIKKDKDTFPIVGIGASAGGLEALEGFIRNIPDETNIAFVVVQHLAPRYKSIMPELLKKYTKMEIHVVKDGMKIEPNCVFLNPPDKEVAIIKKAVQLIEPLESHGARLPIDFFSDPSLKILAKWRYALFFPVPALMAPWV